MSTVSSDVPVIKMEEQSTLLGDLDVKKEPATPTEQLDDDIYEDAGDLDFSEMNPGSVFLARMPQYLWKTWSEKEDEQDVQIGTIRIEGAMDQPQTMSLMLSTNVVQNETVPMEYNLQVTNRQSSNTFTFTEKDLPGYNNRMRAFGKHNQDQAALPFSQAQPRAPLPDRSKAGSKVDKAKRFQSYYRRAIPKRTALTGKVGIEVNCLPVENEAFRKAMAARNTQEAKPLRETILLSGPGAASGGAGLDPATVGTTRIADNFIKTVAPIKAKGQDIKTARIPQNELMDMIVGCFREFRYWYLKDLRARLKQPEQYLRQTLEIVAEMVRQGPQAMTWQLKPEHQKLIADTAANQDLEAPADLSVGQSTATGGLTDDRSI